MLLRARLVLPVASPVIHDGAVRIDHHRIISAGPWKDIPPAHRPQALDLGSVLLLPGLVNAHCHLDYSHMAGKIPPRKYFTDWIQAMVSLKSSWGYSEFAASWLAGARMLLQNGTTTVADVEAVPELLPDVRPSTPLRVFSFHELIHVNPQLSSNDLVQHSLDLADQLPPSYQPMGLSPHAPYSTSPDLLQLARKTAHTRGWRLTTHLAESEEEFHMFMYGTGPLHQWLKNQRNMDDCGNGSPVAYLDKQGYLSPNLLAVHVNYLGPGDAERLAKHQVKVVHCPSSHQYFQHIKFSFPTLEKAGVHVCLGTDSLASTLKPPRPGSPPELNLFHEMRLFAAQYPGVPPEKILKLVTLNAAQALGCAGQIGEISPGARADLITIPFEGPPLQAHQAVLQFPGKVSAAMINGQWVLPPPGSSTP